MILVLDTKTFLSGMLGSGRQNFVKLAQSHCDCVFYLYHPSLNLGMRRSKRRKFVVQDEYSRLFVEWMRCTVHVAQAPHHSALMQSGEDKHRVHHVSV
jgi:hypothetical protein